MLKRTLAIALSLAVIALPSITQATIIDMEANDMLGTASPIIRTSPLFADVGVGVLGGAGGDVDVYSIDLVAGDLLHVNATGIASATFGSDPDMIAALIDPSGVIIEFDDDDGPSFGSNFTFPVPGTGMHFVAVSGFGDGSFLDIGSMFGSGNFDGSHTESGPYILTVSVVPVPEPAALGLAAFAGACLLGLRRRVRS